MKFTFRNVGTVKETELDLRPFTAIIGPNNSNKTYLAYLLYTVWKRASPRGRNQVERIVKLTTQKDESYLIKLDDEFYDKFIALLARINKPTTQELENSFQDSSRKIFKSTSVNIKLERKDIEEAVLNFIHEPFTNFRVDELRVVQNPEGLVLSFMYPDKDVKEYMAKYIFAQGVIDQLYGAIYPFPAERNAFVLTYRMLANRRYKFMRDSQRDLFTRAPKSPPKAASRILALLKEQGESRYPQPLEDFLDFLTDIELSDDVRVGGQHVPPFQELAKVLELKLQGGHQTEFLNTQLGGKELSLKVKKGLTIDLYNASSSIKQLTPLVLYLNHRARKNDLVIIDEPEMNLHPESQAKLMEILAILVNLGVRVLITTHSPYIMAHLNNVRLAGPATAEQRAEKAGSLYLKDARAFLNPDQVMAYEMKDHKLRDLHDPDYGIRWDTLSDVSADLQQTLFKVHTPDEQAG